MENAAVPNIGEVIRAYVKLREHKLAIETETKERIAGVNAKLGKLEIFLRLQMNDQGLTSFKSNYGTAFLITTDYANVADWDAVLNFVRKNGAYDMLERRVSKTAVRNYIEATKAVPPGVNYGTKLGVGIRKPGAKIDD